MAIKTYSVPCPSCEASVTLKPSLAGTKVDCPKCKYRFVAPAPPAEASSDEDNPSLGKAATTAGKKSKKKKAGGSTVMIGAVLGVLAVGMLAAGAFIVFGDSSSSPKKTASLPVQPRPIETPPTDPETIDPEHPTDPMTPMPPNGTATPATKPEPPPKSLPIPVRKRTAPLLEISNLLPANVASVFRINVSTTAETPLFNHFFDVRMQELFRNSLDFSPDQIDAVILCTLKPGLLPFAVIRTRNPINELGMYDRMVLERPQDSPIQGRYYFIIHQNAFLTAMDQAYWPDSSLQSGTTGATRKHHPLAICVLDDQQTILITTPVVMAAFLRTLDKDGYPPYITELTPDPVTTPLPMPKREGDAGNPANPPVSAPGAEPATPPMPATPPATQPPPGPPKLYTSIPTYRTIDRDLKRALNRLEQESSAPPAIVAVQRLDQRDLALQNLPAISGIVNSTIADVLTSIQIAGVTLKAFNATQVSMTGLLEFANDDQAKMLVNERIVPAVTLLQAPLSTVLGTPVMIRNQIPNPNALPAQPGQPGFDAGQPFPSDSATVPPMIDPATGLPVGAPGVPGGMTPGDNTSVIDLAISDRVVTLSAQIFWKEELFSSQIRPAVGRMIAQMKGRLNVLSGTADTASLAGGVAKLQERNQSFPPGALPRKPRSDNFRLPYPPDQRVSFFAELLPFLGHGPLRSQIDAQNHAWYAAENLPAAEAWVPEFLVPYYPPGTWRALDPRAGVNSLGATNYVGLAGLGLDAARYNPNDPKVAKKLGLTGYDWSSSTAQVTDGLSNTIYLIQTAPTTPRPWIAGGGATLIGIDEDSKSPLTGFAHQVPGGQIGTAILMADGSVRFLKGNVSPEIFNALVTRAGGESLTDLDVVAPKRNPKGKNPELRGDPLPPATTPPAESSVSTREAGK